MGGHNKPSIEELQHFVNLSAKTGSDAEAAKQCGRAGTTGHHWRRYARDAGLVPNGDGAPRSLQAQVRELKRQIEGMQREEDTAALIRERIYGLAAITPKPPAWLAQTHKASKLRGCPVTIWSDWHYGEVVRKEEVGGVNEFNAKVAAARIQKLVDSTIELCFHHMGAGEAEYPGIVIALGGDMISGDIHEELAVTNDRTPYQAINDLADLIAAALVQMADKFGKVYVPCVVGNHGRGTHKPRHKGRIHCVTTDTPILTNDLRWVPAGEIEEGRELLAFEEFGSRSGRRFQRAAATYAKKEIAKTVALTLDNGRVLRVTPEHKFLVFETASENMKAEWVSAEEILTWWGTLRRNKGHRWIGEYMPLWAYDTSYEAGYLAAAFDGEGCLSRTNGTFQLSFNQARNAMLDQVKEYLGRLGFEWNVSVDESQVANGHKVREALYIRGGVTEILRFLGTVRPPRLLQKWAEFDISTAFLQRTGRMKVVDVQDGGEQEILSLSSSSKTYLAAGTASHNTSFEWNLYCTLERHFRNDKRIQFDIPEQTDCLFSVYGHRVLLTHGDSLGSRGGDGIIGSLGPIMRGKIKTGHSESQIGRDFDTLMIGHYHQYITLPGLVVNNSLKGYDEYARLFLRAPYSRPSQALFFIHPKHGVTAHWQVYLEDLPAVKTDKNWLKVMA